MHIGKATFLVGIATIAVLGVVAAYLVAPRPMIAPAVQQPATSQPASEPSLPNAGQRTGAAADDLISLPESVPQASESSLVAPAPASRVTAMPRGSVQPPAAALADRYDDLTARARAGDIDAAYQLGSELYKCKIYSERLDDLARVTHPANRSATESQREQNNERVLAELERSEPVADMCAGISSERIAEAHQWFEVAANAGDLRSINDYYTTGVGNLAELATRPNELMRFRENGSRFLHSAARRCNPEALYSLAMSYRHGTVTDVDPMRSFGYALVTAWASGLDPRAFATDERRQALTPLQFNQAVFFARRAYANYCQ